MSLQTRYEKLAADREVYLQRARDCAKVTIPTMFPLAGSNGASKFPTPWQSLGARLVNNLAAKLLLALFPPNAPFFKLSIDDFALQKLTQQEGMRAEVEKALNMVERAVMNELETNTSRPALFEALKQLIVGGNALLFVTKDNKLRVHRLSNYVVKRDPMGNPLEIVIKECISPLELPDGVIAAHGLKADNNEDDVELYTGLTLVTAANGARWKVWQEIKGTTVAGTLHYVPHDRCPARPLRWTALDGEDYGRGMTEEYLGDLCSLEGLQKAIVQGAAAAAKVLFLVRPNGTTKKKAITDAESGAVESGHKDDVTVLQMEKYADFKVALETRQEIITALSFAFMLNTAIQRNGERVTAEEIRYMAQELESSLGGVYSTMSQDLQLPLVALIMGNMERTSRLPALPKGVVKPAVTTGLEAIGRGNDLNRLQGFINALTPLAQAGAPVLDYINVPDFITRTGTSFQLDMAGLVKSDQQVERERQQAQMMALAQRVGPNVVNKGADMMMNQQGASPNG